MDDENGGARRPQPVTAGIENFTRCGKPPKSPTLLPALEKKHRLPFGYTQELKRLGQEGNPPGNVIPIRD